MKQKRQVKILELIREHTIENQNDLMNILNAQGYHATQATISRDIRELNIIKIQTPDGRYKYAVGNVKITDDEISEQAYGIISASVKSIEYAGNLVVLRTLSGMAQAVCAAIDSTHRPGIMGTIAGEDTIFIASRGEDASAFIVSELRKMLSGK